ncbi:MAG: hypothetical protein KGY74_09155 [Candidatus Cloacimonetes bacterium]|nr:hypothetical protein [Candidatus Cloacimonadota bacterium]
MFLKNIFIILISITFIISFLNKYRDKGNNKTSTDRNDIKTLEIKINRNTNKVGKKGNPYIHTSPIKENIISQINQVKPVIYSQRSSTIIFKNYLVQIETWSDTLFHVFNLPDCRYIGGFGRKGRGPKELPFHDAYGATSYKNGIRIYDIYKGLVFIDLTKFDSDKNISIEKKIKLPGELMVLNDIFLLNDNTIIGSNNTQDKLRFKYKYTRYNIYSKKIDYFGQYPDYYRENKRKLYPSIYSSRSVVKPDETKFASFSRLIKMFRIYRYDGTLLKEVFLKKQEDFFDGKWIRKNPINYYKCIRATNEYLYALCHNEHTQNLPNNKPTLEIWDWKGNPIAYLKLDQSICSFDVTDDNSKVYATSFNDMDKIFSYKIKNYIKK